MKTGETAFQHVFGMDTFAYMAANPEIAGFYNEAQTAGASNRTAAVVAAYDFSAGGTVVDVGGGHGTLLIAILAAFPGVRGVLFERESVATGAHEHVEAAGLGSRCEVQAGTSLRTSLARVASISSPTSSITGTTSGAGRSWRTAALRCQAEQDFSSSKKSYRTDSISTRTSVQAALADLHMLAITGGQERTVDEYRRLLANGGFTLTNVIVTSVADRLIEAVPS